MLRTSGFSILAHPEEEVYLCRREPVQHWQSRPNVVPLDLRPR